VLLYVCLEKHGPCKWKKEQTTGTGASMSLSSDTIFSVILLSKRRSSAGWGTSAVLAHLCLRPLLSRCHQDQAEAKRRCINLQSRSEALEAPETYSQEAS